MRDLAAQRVRRRPEATVLYQSVQAGWPTFVQRLGSLCRAVPWFCEREVAAFLRCGILAHGFARVHCDDCGHDDVVAFSCKGRGFCPSCGTRRMVDTAAFLVDRVIPEVAVRQWVLSLPYRVRVLCAYDADVCVLVRRILVRAVSGHYERSARRAGVANPRTGAVAFVQRFDSGLRVNLHFHVLWLDGAYGWEVGKGAPRFAAAAELTDAEVGKLVRSVRDRVVRALRRRGKLPASAAGGEDGGDAADGDVQAELGAAAVQGRAAVGERAGERDVRVGRTGDAAPFAKGPLCAECDGFSLHAAVVVAARDRERLEHLCRYAGRPAIAESRLRELPDGRMAYSLKKRWRDGTTAVVMTRQVLMERLCALVPRPRRHLVTYHGVPGPAAGIRPQVVPAVVGESGRSSCRHGRGGEEGDDERVGAGIGEGSAGERVRQQRRVPHAPGNCRRGQRRYSWAELLRRVFAIEVLVCANCGGRRRLLAAFHDPDSIQRVLAAMGLPAAAPEMAAARSPPRQAELPW